ncbi:OmpA family protein [Rapidithrix thailandica]|uniref:OmpA family protein n=1 Tax=Rapidithrix thailandica TaxID=413964 RepID=A0AAW9RXW2_9BACT
MDVNIPATNVEQAVTFESIDFDIGSSELKPEMENNLHLIIDFLVNRPQFNCKITGHTDTTGDPAINKKLSQERAENIRNYLLSYGGLDSSRVQAVGMGSADPIVKDEYSEKDRKLNRRVEFHMYLSEKFRKKAEHGEPEEGKKDREKFEK